MRALDQAVFHTLVPVCELFECGAFKLALFHAASEEIIGLAFGLCALDDVVESGDDEVHDAWRDAFKERHCDVITDCCGH